MIGWFRSIAPRSSLTAVATLLCLAGVTHAQDNQTALNGAVRLSYQVFGDPDGMPLIVIDGLGIAVRPAGEALTEALVADGFRVVRFDNRDAGRSTALTEAGPPPDTTTIAAALEADAAIVDDLAAGRQGAAPAASGDWRFMLPDIEVPVVVIHGGADPLFPIVHAEQTSEVLPDAQLEIIDGLGHILSDAAANEVASRVAAFVHGLPAATKE